MRVKCYYNRNLKMSPEKLAAQVAHVCIHLTQHYGDDLINTVIVLKATPTKMDSIRESISYTYTQVDTGLTEVPPNTPTVIGYVEDYV